MRTLAVLLFMLILGKGASATDSDASLARALDSLSSQQRTLLYQYGTLKTWAGDATADSFWVSHAAALGAIGKERGWLMAKELLHSTELVYSVQQPSRLQALRGVFTASRLLLGLAGLVAAYAIVQLLGKYLPDLFRWLVRYVRWLFSPRALTWEMLCLGAAGIYWGPLIGEQVIRTVVLHLGICFIWTQLTAILTRRYLINEYAQVIKDSFRDYRESPWKVFVQVSVPALFTSLVIIWVTTKTPDNWYRYEVMVPFMIGIFTLPPLRRMEGVLVRVLFPFPGSNMRSKDERLGAYVVITAIAWGVLLLLPVILPEALLVLSIWLMAMLLVLSIEDVTGCGIKNFIWMQLITLGFAIVLVLTGSQMGMQLVAWTGFGGLLAFVLIKYWEIPTLFGWKWRNKKAWGALGMALLIWAIALLIRSRPEWFALFPALEK